MALVNLFMPRPTENLPDPEEDAEHGAGRGEPRRRVLPRGFKLPITCTCTVAGVIDALQNRSSPYNLSDA
jgi:hypothetical protein